MMQRCVYLEGEAETVSSSPCFSSEYSLVNSALNSSSKQHYHFPGTGPQWSGHLDLITAGLYAFRIICLNSSSLLQKILCV